MKIIVTGGAGFMGSEFVRQAVKRRHQVVVVDKLTYASNLLRLKDVKKKIRFYQIDICQKKKLENILRKETPKAIVHFAAETHVDRSIQDATSFVKTNVKGTHILLDLSLKYKIKRFIHISTDEVYGEIKKGRFSENSPLQPNSPYAATKAAADLLIKAYIRTYRFPAIIVRPCNNYGPWQYPEKLIPLAIARAVKNLPVPVYARGLNMREWLYVADCAQALLAILKGARVGQVYNVGSGEVKKNLEIIKNILALLGRPLRLIRFVKDRPGHDFRYALNSRKIHQELGWQPKTDFTPGLCRTVQWYLRQLNESSGSKIKQSSLTQSPTKKEDTPPKFSLILL